MVIPVSTDSGTTATNLTGLRGQRADARRNRERVLEAAEQVFSEQGVGAPIEEVARRAGLGVGTVCRHFPTKRELVEAVLEALTETMLKSAASALAERDPARALRRFAVKLVDVTARHRVLAEQLPAVDAQPPTGSSREQLRSAIAELLERGQRAGVVRDDVGPGDVAALLAGVAQVSSRTGSSQQKFRERAVSVILDGLRPDNRTELPGRPLGFADIDRPPRRQAAAPGAKR